jgi:hypothetical protein
MGVIKKKRKKEKRERGKAGGGVEKFVHLHGVFFIMSTGVYLEDKGGHFF